MNWCPLCIDLSLHVRYVRRQVGYEIIDGLMQLMCHVGWLLGVGGLLLLLLFGLVGLLRLLFRVTLLVVVAVVMTTAAKVVKAVSSTGR